MKSNKKKGDNNQTEENKPTSGISLMKHNRLRVLSESSSNKIISSKNDLLLSSNASNSSLDTSSSSSSNNDISNSDTNDVKRTPAPLISASSYSVDTRRYSSRDSTQHINSLDSIVTDPSTLAQPIRQELQIKAKESISDIILACRSFMQSSNVSNDLSKAAYNFSLLDSVFSDIDNSITKINQNLSSCKQKNEEITKSLEELNEAQEGSRRIKDLIVAYITE
ncbi:hypothetical protein PIROE2DRAFT_18418 [Piromyces sp. E2]|nr:hypothetical protein PIROE2DRAFT_18418 [Piromyces sp. E2]|eukprot:OUM56820.1 hypothetical protein PIROE2DRAFT_18418 [Piromyces sp. E2]